MPSGWVYWSVGGFIEREELLNRGPTTLPRLLQQQCWNGNEWQLREQVAAVVAVLAVVGIGVVVVPHGVSQGPQVPGLHDWLTHAKTILSTR